MQLTDLNKATAQDKTEALREAVSSSFSTDNIYAYYIDHDDNYVYAYLWVEGKKYDVGIKYTSSGSNGLQVELEEDFSLVSRETVYTFIADTSEENLERASTPPKRECSLLYKEFPNEEKMQVIECLYIAIDDVDGVGDTYGSEEVCYAMVESFNKAIEEGRMKGNYFHHPNYFTDDFSPVKAWVTEADCYIGEVFVKKGQPLVLNQFYNKEAYAMRKAGEFKGVSIGAKACAEAA